SLATNMPSNNGISTPEHPLPTLLILAKIFWVRAGEMYFVEWVERADTSDDTLIEDVSNQGRKIDELDRDEGAVLMNEQEEIEEVRNNADDAQVEGRQADICHIDMDHATKVLSMQEDEPEIQEAVEGVTTSKLITEVVAAVSETDIKVAVPSTRRRRGVVIRDPEEESSTKTPTETKSKDKGKGMSYDDIRPIFEAKFNANMEFLLKSKEQMEEEDSRAIAIINETPAQKAAKRRRLNKEITADAIAELNSFHEVRLALIDCRIMYMMNFHWLEKKAL
nr:hypothetical protein [Tanacetum cinerariifolium]